jgi:hypothetical protein
MYRSVVTCALSFATLRAQEFTSGVGVSDNYFALMHGEARTIRTELEHADTHGERPALVLAGFNVHTSR